MIRFSEALLIKFTLFLKASQRGRGGEGADNPPGIPMSYRYPGCQSTGMANERGRASVDP